MRPGEPEGAEPRAGQSGLLTMTTSRGPNGDHRPFHGGRGFPGHRSGRTWEGHEPAWAAIPGICKVSDAETGRNPLFPSRAEGDLGSRLFAGLRPYRPRCGIGGEPPLVTRAANFSAMWIVG